MKLIAVGKKTMGLAGLAAMLVLASMGGRALAQAQNTGTVAGNVTDAQGAVVPGAIITLSANGQGRKETVKSDRKGEYLFSDVPVGKYTLKVSAATFESYVVDGIEVNADANVREDAHMLAGSVEASVTVESSGTTIDTRSATIGTMIDSKLVEGLPIDGENLVSLAALLPGVTNVSAPTTFTSDTGGPTYSVSGSRGNQNLFLFDGIIWNNVFYNTGLNYPPRLASEEVSVLLNNYKAQYGRNSGSIFNVLTKRGSNAIHGNLWEYYQSSAFNTADYFSHVNPHLVQNQFGGTIGGPIKRDKAYYFFAYQDLRLAGQVTAQAETPFLAELGYDAPGVPHLCGAASPFAGQQCGNYTQDFSYTGPGAVTLATAVRNPIYYGGSVAITSLNTAYQQQTGNPTAVSPCVTALQAYMLKQTTTSAMEHLPTPELPVSCFNPLSVNFINKYVPLANTYLSNSNIPFAISTANQPRNDQEGLARVDLNLGRHTIDARFFVTNVNDVTSNSVSQGVGVANYEQDLNVAGIYSASIGDTWVLTPNLLNVFRAGYKRYTYIIIPQDRTNLQQLGASYLQPGHSFLPKLEASGRFTVGSSNSGDSTTVTANIELDDNLSWTRGNHNYQTGLQVLDLDYVHRFDQTPTIISEQQNTGVATGDFLLGLINNETFGNSTNLAARQYALYAFAQDDWRATSRLTLNYGIRYELPFSWKEIDGQGATFKPGYQSVVWPGSPSSVAYQNDPGIGNTAPPTKYYNVAPRFGVVYDLFGDGHTSLRAGAGLFYDSVNANVVGVSEPYHYSAYAAAPAGGFTSPLLGLSCIPSNYVKGQPVVSIGAPGCQPTNTYFTLPYTINYADGHLKNPYTEAFNAGFQQRIAKGSTLEMNYVGKFGRHGMIALDQNPSIYDCSGSYYQANPTLYCPGSSVATTAASYQARSLYPGFNYGGQGIVDNESIGTSNYNGLQVVYSQRALKNITTYASYAYSRSIDISSAGTTNTAHVPQPNHLDLEYAASDFNATHIFNIGWVVKLPNTSQKHGVIAEAFNDWTFGGIYNARTGNPVNITIAGDQSFTDQRTQRPSLAPGANPNLPSNRHRSDKILSWFSTSVCQGNTGVTAGCVWVVPKDGTFGTLRRNSQVGPGYINTNMDVQKNFQIVEGKSLEFRLDAYNVFNTPNLAQPNGSIASSSSAQIQFGSIISTVGTNGSLGANGRRMQLGLILRY